MRFSAELNPAKTTPDQFFSLCSSFVCDDLRPRNDNNPANDFGHRQIPRHAEQRKRVHETSRSPQSPVWTCNGLRGVDLGHDQGTRPRQGIFPEHNDQSFRYFPVFESCLSPFKQDKYFHRSELLSDADVAPTLKALVLGSEFLSERHEGWYLRPFKSKSVQWASRFPAGFRRLLESSGDALYHVPFGSGRPPLPHRRIHRLAVLHRHGVSGGDPGRRGGGNPGWVLNKTNKNMYVVGDSLSSLFSGLIALFLDKLNCF